MTIIANGLQDQYVFDDFMESLESMVDKIHMKAYGPISIHMEGEGVHNHITVMIKKDRLIITTGRGMNRKKYRIFRDMKNGLQ